MRNPPPRARLLAAGALTTLLVTALATALATAGAVANRPGKERGKPGGSADARPLVIGHRGAAGYRPEHTLASYELAARMGADFIEPDLVSTKDGVLVARHENEISATTDVADRPEFADRRTTKTVDGVALTGWFTEDFTLAELKSLRAKERIPEVRQRNTIYDGRFEVPTFDEVLDLRRRLSRELGREIGVYPETKHPTYFRSIGLALERPLVRALRGERLDRRRSPAFVQSFETRNLRMLDRRIDTPLVQLYGSPTSQPFDLRSRGRSRTYGDLATPRGLRRVSRYADGVGPPKGYIVPRNPDGSSGSPTSFVDDAHRAGLVVHPYTFRNENQFLPLELRSSADPNAYGDAISEYEQFFALGVDGLFSDNPDTAVEAREGR
jgi:glycerophosphoryl diester phosphodiesterase